MISYTSSIEKDLKELDKKIQKAHKNGYAQDVDELLERRLALQFQLELTKG
jgi:hypothetical protein